MYDETVAALKHDREIANEEESIRRQHDTKRIEELLLKIRKLQDFCRDNTRGKMNNEWLFNMIELL